MIETYDDIIVGAGSAGATLATRLTEDLATGPADRGGTGLRRRGRARGGRCGRRALHRDLTCIMLGERAAEFVAHEA